MFFGFVVGWLNFRFICWSMYEYFEGILFKWVIILKKGFMNEEMNFGDYCIYFYILFYILVYILFKKLIVKIFY